MSLEQRRRILLMNNNRLILPTGYNFCDYIIGNSNAFITTNIYLSSESIVYSDLSFKSAGNVYGRYSGSNANDNFCFYGGSSTASGYVRWDGSLQRVFIPTTNQRYKIEHSYKGFYVDGVLYGQPFSDGTHQHFDCSAPFRVGHLSNSSADKFNGTIYRVMVVDDGQVILDLRPCTYEDNNTVIFGLYDIVGKQFYRSEATNFTQT